MGRNISYSVNSPFGGIESLSSLTIGNSVTDIGNSAFKGCSGLTSVTLPNSVTSIGDFAFTSCSGLTEPVYNSNIFAQLPTSYEGSYIIPQGITSVVGSAFSGCSGLTSITIPESVTDIARYTFYGCSGLTSITIPNSVTSIGVHAFSGCSGLTSITIPNSVTSIGSMAFFGCSGLTSIVVDKGNSIYYSPENSNAIIKKDEQTLIVGCTKTIIPYGVKSIGSSAFQNCSGLTSITIPNSVTSIGSSAFSGCSGLTSITIPNSVTSIGTFAFYGCSGLTSITIPNSVTSIGSSAFENCKGLTSITIPNSVTSIGSSAFQNCSGLTSVTLPNSVTSIGTFAFKGCNNLTRVFSMIRSPHNLNEAFAGISSECYLFVPTGTRSSYIHSSGWDYFNSQFVIEGYLPNISNLSFVSPTEVLETKASTNTTLRLTPTISPSTISNKDLTWSSSDEDIATVSGSGLVTGKEYGTATITCSAVNQQGELVSASCRVIVYKAGLMYVDSIFYDTTGGSAAVTNCAGGLPSNVNKERYEYSGTINVPASVTYDGVNYPVKAIGTYAFYNQPELQAVQIPTSVLTFEPSAFEKSKNLARVLFLSKEAGLISVGERAFYECSKLNNVVLPNSTQRIDREGFRHCSSLSNITLSNSLNYINEYAFADCPVLNNVVLPESLKSIQNAAFNNDAALSSITFPAALEGIGAAAFANCASLKEVTFNTTNYTMTIGSDAFKGSNAINKVKVAHLDSWVSINFSNPEANPASISHRLYNTGGTEFTDAVVPEGPSYVNNNVFYNCQNLKSVTLPTTIQIINDNIFYGCTSLIKVVSKAITPPDFTGVLDPSMMNNVFNSADLYVPAESVSSYSSDDWWKRFRSVKKLTEFSSLTITADNLTMVYGDNVPKLTYKVNGATLNGTPKLSTTATKTSAVGTYAIKVEKGTVTNTNVNFVNGTLTITKAPLTITAKSYTIKQGEALPTFAATYSGFKNSETESVLSKKPTFSCAATSASAPGTYDITVSGAEAGNYNISYAKGTLTIEKKDEPATRSPFKGEISLPGTLEAENFDKGGEGITYHDNDAEDHGGTNYRSGDDLGMDIVTGNGGYAIGWTNGGEWIEYSVNVAKAGKYTYEAIISNGTADKGGFSISLVGKDGKLTKLADVSVPSTESNWDKYQSVKGDLLQSLAAGSQIFRITITDGNCNIDKVKFELKKDESEPDYKSGDANGDGSVNVFDVTAIVNYILGSPSGTFVSKAADVNNDGNVNVFDVTKVVNIILGVNAGAKMRGVIDMNEGRAIIASTSEKNMDIVVNDAERYVAMQFDVLLPENSTLQNVALNNTAGHALAYRQVETNRYRVIAYSTQNSTFEPTEEALVSLSFSDGNEAEIENAQFITANGHSIFMVVADEATNIVEVEGDIDEDVIYNMAGQYVGNNKKALPKGIYICNGKKFVVQ